MRIIVKENGIEEIKPGDRCLYRFTRLDNTKEKYPCIVEYKAPSDDDTQSEWFFYGENEHPGYAVITESFKHHEMVANTHEVFKWSDDFFIKKIDEDMSLSNFPEYFI